MLILFGLVWLTLLGGHQTLECRFNPLCLCTNYTVQYHDVTCISVPLDRLPGEVIGEQFPLLYRLRIVGSQELTNLGPDSFEGLATLGSLVISKSKLSWIERNSFVNTSITATLSSLEISFSDLTELPAVALAPLSRLQWLSLKGNKIEILRAKDFSDGQLGALRNLILSENQVTIIEDATFSSLSQLERLELDSNLIERVEGLPFPTSLKSLSLSNCLLRKVPFSSLSNLANLNSLQLRGNLIAHLSPFKFTNRHLHLVDLSHNLINKLSDELFSLFAHDSTLSYPPSENATSQPLLRIDRLYLDFNFIQSLPAELFRSVEIAQLTLSSNRIRSDLIDPGTFAGPLESMLKILDFNYNLLDRFPEALKRLRHLKQLTLKNNRLSYVDEDSFQSAAHTLEVLDLSQNVLDRVPSEALSVLRTLFKINLHDNLITKVSKEDFAGPWCEQVRSITLSKNSLRSVDAESFDTCIRLTELRIGGNRLLEIQPFTEIMLSNQLQLLEMSSLASVTDMLQEDDEDTVSYNGYNKVSQSKVKWLQFDYNGLRHLPSKLFELFPSLMYLDLQNNRISVLSSAQMSQFENLTTLIMSQNNLDKLPSGAFRRLEKLESISLYFNRIKNIHERAFEDLPKLQSLILSRNQLSKIVPGTFHNLSRDVKALTLMLDENRIERICAQDFADLYHPKRSNFSIFLNLSGNSLEDFDHCKSQETQLLIEIMDISKNRLTSLNENFFETFLSKATSLIANENSLTELRFDALCRAKGLQTLSLDLNKLTEIQVNSDSNTKEETLSIQTLSLRQNGISALNLFFPFFQKTTKLKTLDLSQNSIEIIENSFFSNTQLLKLNLEGNSIELSNSDSQDCFGVAKTLKFLNLKHNRLQTIPSRVMACSNLVELYLSDNQIVTLSSVSSIAKSIPHLKILDLERNPFREQLLKLNFLTGHMALMELKLNHIGDVGQLEELAVPFLRRLELAQNSLESIQSKVLSKSRNIRHLGLAANSLTEVPKHVWKYVTRLQTLELQDNPIEILDSSSFAGLKYLRHLNIRGLPLQFLDSRILLYQSQLSSLAISTHPAIRGFRLKDILAKSDALKTVEIDVAESILTHQIQWAFGGKLRELIITGKSLNHIVPDSFQGLNNANDLTLRITNTSIERLPDSLLRYLADIRYITIDLRDNLLKTVAPTVFFDRFLKTDAVKTWQSRQMLGGIILSNNPLECDCNLLWISQWMQELFSEMKSINIDAAIHVKASLSASTCQLKSLRNKNITEKRSIAHLTEHDVGIHCQAAASFRASPKSSTSSLETFPILILILYFLQMLPSL